MSLLGTIGAGALGFATGGASLALGLGGLAGSMSGAHEANVANKEIARKNRLFQEQMSSTAYQRAVQDMRLAGLNPMLAYAQGGASTPSGSIANMVDEVTPGISSALQSSRVKADIENLHATNEQIKASTKLNEELSVKAAHDAAVSAAQAKLLNFQIPRARNEAAPENSKLGQVAAWWDRIWESAGGTVSSFFRPKSGGGITINNQR